MSDILDDDLVSKPNHKSPYGKWSNIPVAFVMLGVLFRLMHWANSDLLLIVGVSAHFGIELGYFIALKARNRKNNRRLVLTTIFNILIPIQFIGFNNDGTTIISLIFTLSAFCAAATYFSVKMRYKRL